MSCDSCGDIATAPGHGPQRGAPWDLQFDRNRGTNPTDTRPAGVSPTSEAPDFQQVEIGGRVFKSPTGHPAGVPAVWCV